MTNKHIPQSVTDLAIPHGIAVTYNPETGIYIIGPCRQIRQSRTGAISVIRRLIEESKGNYRRQI